MTAQTTVEYFARVFLLIGKTEADSCMDRFFIALDGLWFKRGEDRLPEDDFGLGPSICGKALLFRYLG